MMMTKLQMNPMMMIAEEHNVDDDYDPGEG
jgi:hypothetical protein